MATIKNTTLKTAVEVALAATERQYRKARAAAEWASRLDPAAYDCRKEGNTWIADGPAGQSFEFTKTEADDVLVLSASGGLYLIAPSALTGDLVCDCPAHRNAGTCKHLAAFEAVKRTHRANKLAEALPLAA